MTFFRLGRSQLAFLLSLLSAVGVLALFPFMKPPGFYLTLLVLVFIYVTLSSSWNWLGGMCGYLNFAHAAFFGAGAYFSALMAIYYNVPQLYTAPVAGLVGAALAVLLGFPAFRFRGVYFGIVSLCLVFVFQIISRNLEVLGGGQKLFPPTFWINSIIVYESTLLIMLIALIVTLAIRASRFGMGLITIRQSEETAACLGIPVLRYKIMAFALGSFFASVAGAFYPLIGSSVYPAMAYDVSLSINPVVMSILGGTSSWIGPVIGAVILTPLTLYLAYFLRSELHVVFYGAFLVCLVSLQPGGIVTLIRRIRTRKGQASSPAEA